MKKSIGLNFSTMATSKKVELNIELYHKCSVKDIFWKTGAQTVNKGEATHDWEFQVMFGDLSKFVNKIVFHLHRTYSKPKRTVLKPPFSVKDSGYGTFTMIVDIFFLGIPKTQVKYDIILSPSLESLEGANVESLQRLYTFSETRKILVDTKNQTIIERLITCGGILISSESSSNVTKCSQAPKSRKRKYSGRGIC